MAQRRAGRAGRVVEVDDPLLDRDEHRDGGRELRHRRPAERRVDAAVRQRRPVRVHHGHGTGGARPAVDLPKRLHTSTLSSDAPPAHLLRGRVRRTRRLLARRARRSHGLGLRHRADPAGRRRSARRTRTSRRGSASRSSRRALEEAGSSLDDVVRTRIYVTDAGNIDDVGRAHRRRSRPPARRRPASSPSCSTRGGWSRSRSTRSSRRRDG